MLLRPEPPVRLEVFDGDRVIMHYSAAGDLVRIDLDEAPDPPDKVYDPADLYMGLRSAAEWLGVHPATLRRSASKGTLRTARIGTQLLTTAAWLHEYEQNRRGPGRPRKSA